MTCPGAEELISTEDTNERKQEKDNKERNKRKGERKTTTIRKG